LTLVDPKVWERMRREDEKQQKDATRKVRAKSHT
jgi:hypothetical protein